MATIVTRAGKGSPLTNTEVDSNFTNLNTDKLEKSGGTMTGDLTFGDNDKAIFGAGSDLQIYSNGTDSFIDNGGGNLYIRDTDYSGDIYIQPKPNENAIVAYNDSSVVLFYDNAAKLTTTSTGIDVTGTVTADGLTVEDTQASGGVGIDIINVGDGGVSTTPYTYIASKLNPSRDGGEIRFTRASTYGSESTADSNIELYTATDSVNKLVFKAHSGGDISFYEDTGTTPKFFWDASAESLGIGTSSPSSYWANADDLVVSSSGSTGISVVSGTTSTGYLMFADSTTPGDTTRGGLGYDHSTNSMLFRVNNDTKMTIDSSGNVGVGTSSPTSRLDVVEDFGAGSGIAKLRITGKAQGAFGGSSYLEFAYNDYGNVGTPNILGSIQSVATVITPTDVGGDLRFTTKALGGTAATSPIERMRINSSGNVGIGTSSPSSRFHSIGSGATGQGIFQVDTTATSVSGNTATTAFPHCLSLYNPNNTQNNNIASLGFSVATTNATSNAAIAAYSTAAGSAALTFHTESSNVIGERMRIDSSGNLLVGTTSSTSQGTDDGLILRQSGYLFVTKSSDAAAYFHRRTTDGDIVQFRKNTTTVGSIGTAGGQSYIHGAGTDTGLYWGSNNLYPYRSTGFTDNSIDIGQSSYRFKNLYLSGGVYLGGTGAANHLDDYEEGTFDVTLRRNGYAAGDHTLACSYRKIGNTVIVNFVNDGTTAPFFYPNGNPTSSGQTVEIVSQLPFTPARGNCGVRLSHTRTLADPYLLSIGAQHNSTAIYLGKVGVGNSYSLQNNAVTDSAQSNITIIGTLVYQTD